MSVRFAWNTHLHFHDTRHEGITRLAKKLEVLDLARMVGIRDLSILMVYYKPTATEIAERLAAAEQRTAEPLSSATAVSPESSPTKSAAC